MPPKHQRLSVANFTAFFKRGRRFSGTYVTLIYTPHDSFAVAVVVGKKVYKRAVDRNRLRRQLYPTVRSFMQIQQLTGVVQCLVKPAASSVSVQLVQHELTTLLAEATKAR